MAMDVVDVPGFGAGGPLGGIIGGDED